MGTMHSLRSSTFALVLLATSIAPTGGAQEPALEFVPGEVAPAIGWATEVRTIRSEVLDEELRLFVAKPPSFGRAARAYPVLYLLDGQYYFAEVHVCVAALAGTGQIPELLLVGIESRDRRRDFTPAGIELPDVGDEARADRYLDFLEHELVPAVESELAGGRPRVLLGHSHAGVLALHAVAARPAVFPWALDLDTPVHLQDGFLGRDLERALSEPSTPPVRVVSFESVFGWPDERWAALERRARPADFLRRNAIVDESHQSMVFAASYRGLKQLFADYSTLTARDLPTLEIEGRYQALAPLYGAEVVPPEPLLRSMIDDFLMEGYGARAGVWLERYRVAYGLPSDDASLAQRVKEMAALGEPEETVAELLALPRATPEEMKAHLGEWVGSMWIEDGPRIAKTVRFWVEGGVVQGESIAGGPAVRFDYIRFRADGALEFGSMNGMRPRGIAMFEERQPGGALEGEMNFRGIRFTPLQGDVAPKWRFELERSKETGG